MEINEEQLPPSTHQPPPERGSRSGDKPDVGSKPDLRNPQHPEEGHQPPDLIPDMDPAGMDPDEDEPVN